MLIIGPQQMPTYIIVKVHNQPDLYILKMAGVDPAEIILFGASKWTF